MMKFSDFMKMSQTSSAKTIRLDETKIVSSKN